MLKLDTKQPYATIIPPLNGRGCYSQGTRIYGPDGDLLFDLCPPAAQQEIARIYPQFAKGGTAPAKRGRKTKAAAADDPAAAAVVPQAEPPNPVFGEYVPPPGSVKAAAPDAGDVDLAAWAKGKVEYPWFRVVKAIRTKHARQVRNKADALDFLIEIGVISTDEIPKEE